MENRNLLGEFLEHLRGDMSLRDAAKKSGLSHTYIRDLELGVNRKTKAPIKPSPDTLKRLSDAYGGGSYEELMKKAGYFEQIPLFEIDESNNVVFPHEGYTNEFVDLPVLGTIRAGQPIDQIENYEGTYPVLKRTINGFDAFWLKVKGESMSGDEIHEGDLVCIIVTPEVNSSDIAAVSINREEATLKRVKFLDGKCILTPSNRNMEPMIYPAEHIHVIGKVVGFQRYYK